MKEVKEMKEMKKTNDLIERYIYDLTRRLPEDERSEVKRELEASIADMLPDTPGEQDIIDVLTELGPPRLLAEQYRQKQRYLISPAMFELYISVLKTVVILVAVVCACVGAIITVFTTGLDVETAESAGEAIGTGIGAAIGMAVEGALQAAFWVTLGFVIAERVGLKNEPWTVNDLPQLPEQANVKISRSSSIAGMILSVFFPVLFIIMITQGEWFFVWVRASEVIIPFSHTALERCIPFLNLLGAIGLVINGLKLYYARWNIRLCIANIIQNIAWLSIVIYILNWPDLFSNEIVEFTKTVFGGGDEVQNFVQSGGIVLFFTVVFVAAAVIDSVVSVWSTWKGRREQQPANV